MTDFSMKFYKLELGDVFRFNGRNKLYKVTGHNTYIDANGVVGKMTNIVTTVIYNKSKQKLQ